MEFPKSVEYRLNLFKAFGFTIVREQAEIQLAQLGEKRWFEAKNIMIE